MNVTNFKKYFKLKSREVVFRSILILCMANFSHETETTEHSELCRKSLFKLSLFSQQNANGQWETEVQLDSNNGTYSSENDLQLDVKQTLVACNCTNKILSIEANIIAPPLRPGMNYSHQPGLGYYYLHRTPYYWAEANRFCNSEGAHLLIVDSQVEADYVKRVIRENENLASNNQYYIGLQRQANLRIATLYGQIYQPPVGVAIDERGTTGTSNDNCGTLNYEGKIKFTSCNQMFAFICEQEE